MPSKTFSSLNKFKGKRRRSRTVLREVNRSTDKLETSFDVIVSGDSSDLDLHDKVVDSNNGDSNFQESATEKKLSKFHHENLDEEDLCGYRIVDVSFLKSLISQLQCPKCNNSLENCALEEENNRGLSSKFDVICSACQVVISSASTSKRLKDVNESNRPNTTGFDVNRRCVMAMKELGVGKADLDKLSKVFDMPSSLGKEAFTKHLKKLEAASSESAQDHLQETSKIICKAYTEVHPDYEDEDIIDIDVVSDGTWQKRGFSSKYNVTVITDLLTGLALDFEVLTNYCHVCAKNKMDKSSIEYGEWRITALNDGNGPYGREHPVENEDCVNHISKRMKNGLDTVITKLKAQGEPIDGKGRLTKERVKAIQNYYGRAIKDNAGDLEVMYRSTWAIYLHHFDDDENQHHRCPSGPESWCWYQRQLARGISTPSRGEHTAPLPQRISQAILSVFERLCSKTLLSGCIRGATQNANESFNQLIWKQAPKHRFTSYQSVCHAVNLCCMEFNKGSKSALIVMEKAGLVPSCNAENFCLKRDAERKRQSLFQGTERFKKIRKSKELEFLKSD
ncbi:hypothetical protein LOTGIDRAFT_155053 [Lottia gigantea]|uniref:Mutator-like transposase domain-containing protein n=1 Tax=Lottia gigantea TaxID=225164 RepID=V3Z4F9_LOTGI|nr:hypothetical protein LOTGIDRAFT_155053 [Lottia gigantea]ESO85563.1 hypothetical protein LOTGIDRAFT_155053 [Lottia gigantea]